MSRAEWSVSTMYSWPSAIAVAAIASIGAPPSLQVEWRWQSPFSASRYTCPSGVIDTCDSASILARYAGSSPVSASVMTAAVDDPMPSRSVSVFGLRPLGEFVGRRVADDVERPDERLRLEARVVRPVEAVDHPQQCLLRRHRSGASIAVPSGHAPIVLNRARRRRHRLVGSLGRLMERFGLVGLPNAGKSSLYNALTGGGALAAPYPFATKDPNIGVAKVPDDRLDRLAVMSKSKNIVHASVEVVDIGGLVEGASKGEGLGNKFLANIREVDAIVFVLRAFVNDDITGPSDPLEHLRIVEIELALADLETVEKRLKQTQRAAKLDKSMAEEAANLEIAYDALAEGLPLYRAGLKPDVREALAPYFLLTNRRVLVVVNVGEDDLDSIPREGSARRRRSSTTPATTSRSSACACRSKPRRRRSPTPTSAPRSSRDSASARARCSAWCAARTTCSACARTSRPARRSPAPGRSSTGSTAPECAGRIHTDFQRGFIQAEVIQWDELLELGSWNAAKDAGKMRVEGKDYVAQDGDVMEFRFNV